MVITMSGADIEKGNLLLFASAGVTAPKKTECPTRRNHANATIISSKKGISKSHPTVPPTSIAPIRR